jgi:hypothetical protein
MQHANSDAADSPEEIRFPPCTLGLLEGALLEQVRFDEPNVAFLQSAGINQDKSLEGHSNPSLIPCCFQVVLDLATRGIWWPGGGGGLALYGREEGGLAATLAAALLAQRGIHARSLVRQPCCAEDVALHNGQQTG